MADRFLEQIDRQVAANMEATVADLARLCAVPSVAALGTGMQECAELVSQMLRERDFEVELISTTGYPVVYAEAPGRRDDQTLLFYNHYDVQPAEPFDLWDSPPFELTQRDGAVFARGSVDDKGHLMCRLAALDAIRAVTGEYPCRLKFVIEGEEEIGSVNLPPVVEANTEKFAADACIWEVGGVNHEERPTQYLGMRGIIYLELSVRSAARDSHSGLAGSIFPNAAWRLTWALATLKDQNEHILIPGFYDDVIPASERDLEMLAIVPDPAKDYMESFELQGFVGGVTDGVELLRQSIFEPTCTICGLNSGYQGNGMKTVLPAEARAKVDFRLVPDQDPEKILARLRAHLDAEGFDDVEITAVGGEPPARTDPDHPFVKLAIATAKDVYGSEVVVMPMMGGSGPIHAFINHLNVPIVTCGAAHSECRAHAPNENMRLDLFELGIRHTAHIVEEFSS